jgi:hypothetical protein
VNIIKHVGKESNQSRRGRARSREHGIPDNPAIHSVICSLDVQKSHDRILMARPPIMVNQVIKADCLVQSTTLWTETTLGDIKKRRTSRYLGGQTDLKELTENRSQ